MKPLKLDLKHEVIARQLDGLNVSPRLIGQWQKNAEAIMRLEAWEILTPTQSKAAYLRLEKIIRRHIK